MRYPDAPKSLLQLEEEILARWQEEKLFARTLEASAGGEPFVFYEGPPTANGRPGLHHIFSRAIKDLVCRHRTMKGHSVTRIAGWDTHGLPVEIEAEKKLGISGKPDIEKYGIERFNQVCRDSVFTYQEEWERLSERIGYWLDYSRPYVTFHTPYIESVWWILKELADRGLLYRGQKSVPYCPRCGTTLSSHEVAQGYEDVEDPSLYFLAEWEDAAGVPDPERRAFLVWTTTPWTVPSNTALAVRADMTYAEVVWEGRRLVLAESRVAAVLGEGVEVLRRWKGKDLVGQRYRRVLDLVPVPRADLALAWRVVAEDFVTADDGSGIVHIAPAFGADDYQSGLRHGFPLLRPVDDRGRFVEGLPVVGGVFVKDADPALIEELRNAGGLFRVGTITHSYPHCWRCRSPLLYMARDSWFAATSSLKDQMLANNRAISWYPPEMKEGRFGEWLENNVDWALSRERFWGTPLPVWTCDEDPSHVDWIGSISELRGRAGALPEGFDPHRPFIDAVTWGCSSCRGTMRRDPVVVDVWFDSGAMPYAQWHWPHENEEIFRSQFPADFICEGLDQTRGWFYSLLAIGTMLDLGPVYKNVIVNGLVLDAEGLKMSKSRGNVVNPWDAIGAFGSDALRWYFITSSNPWLPKRYDPAGVGEAARRLFDTLLNTYRFFALYANAEEWKPDDAHGASRGGTARTSGANASSAPPAGTLLDRWVVSRANRMVGEVGRELDGYQLTRAYRLVQDFLSEDLSNWYVRRSRPRFWGNTDEADSRAAFQTLWEALLTTARLTAPITPFFSDWLHRALAADASVHLAAFPTANEGLVDAALEAEMDSVRRLVSLGRAAREEVKIRVRQPLRSVTAVVPPERRPRAELLELLKDELNVKEVRFLDSADQLVHLVGKPNFRALGPRFQRRSEAAAAAIRALSHESLAAFRRGEEVSIHVDGEDAVLQREWLDVAEEAATNLVVKAEEGYAAALDPAIDPELKAEGIARELVNRIQRLRKESGLEITDRIRLAVDGPDEVRAALTRHRDFIARETLATKVDWLAGGANGDGYDAVLQDEIDGAPIRLALSRAG